MKRKEAISNITKYGMLLAFPIDNASEPRSLWSLAYPRSKMLWEWDENGDDRVSSLWHLRSELSASTEVVYTKWYKGRATFFSRDNFTLLLAAYMRFPSFKRSLSREALEILNILGTDSPLSTKQLKVVSGLKGRANERIYNHAMKELWSRLLIVGYGEVDDGAFPSLAVGATRVLFEDLYRAAVEVDDESIVAELTQFFKQNSNVKKFYERTLRAFPPVRANAKNQRPSVIVYDELRSK